MFPMTKNEAMDALRRAFNCEPLIQDAVDYDWHGITVCAEAGYLDREGANLGSFHLYLADDEEGRTVAVHIEIGPVGELCGTLDDGDRFNGLVRTLRDYNHLD